MSPSSSRPSRLMCCTASRQSREKGRPIQSLTSALKSQVQIKAAAAAPLTSSSSSLTADGAAVTADTTVKDVNPLCAADQLLAAQDPSHITSGLSASCPPLFLVQFFSSVPPPPLRPLTLYMARVFISPSTTAPPDVAVLVLDFLMHCVIRGKSDTPAHTSATNDLLCF